MTAGPCPPSGAHRQQARLRSRAPFVEHMPSRIEPSPRSDGQAQSSRHLTLYLRAAGRKLRSRMNFFGDAAKRLSLSSRTGTDIVEREAGPALPAPCGRPATGAFSIKSGKFPIFAWPTTRARVSRPAPGENSATPAEPALTTPTPEDCRRDAEVDVRGRIFIQDDFLYGLPLSSSRSPRSRGRPALVPASPQAWSAGDTPSRRAARAPSSRYDRHQSLVSWPPLDAAAALLLLSRRRPS